MVKLNKIKIAIVAVLAIIAIFVSFFGVSQIKSSYQSIEKKEVTDFDTSWADVWDSNRKILTENLLKYDMKKLEELANTPSQNNKLKLAQVSIGLLRVKSQSSSLQQMIAEVNHYYEFESYDNEYPEQQKINLGIVKEIESLITQVNTAMGFFHSQDDQVVLDTNITEHTSVKSIETNLPWKEKYDFNKNILALNELNQEQVHENNNKKHQEEIINLKSELDDFLASTQIQIQTIKDNYITTQEAKLISQTISKIDIGKNKKWFDALISIDSDEAPATYEVWLSKQFFEDHPEIAKYESFLADVIIHVDLYKTTTTTSQRESKKEAFKISIPTTFPGKDSDLIRIDTLSNMRIMITQIQEIEKYESLQETTTTSSSSNSEEED